VKTVARPDRVARSRSARDKRLGGLGLALFILSLATPALSQSYVQPPCPARSAPTFEDGLQPLWYRRFWTGECKGLSALKCRRGQPYWNDVVHTLTARAPPARRAEAAGRACRLGRQIGLEWTRPSAVRRINTRDLQALNATLEKSPDVLSGLSAVEARVRPRVKLSGF
jgi:hypothetical protein